MSESTTASQTSDDLWNKARDAGLFSETQGTNAFDLAINQFAAAVLGAPFPSQTGGPAFPLADPMLLEPANVVEMKRLAEGMTLRDYFAAKAALVIGCPSNRVGAAENKRDVDNWATRCYALADAMLRARGAA